MAEEIFFVHFVFGALRLLRNLEWKSDVLSFYFSRDVYYFFISCIVILLLLSCLLFIYKINLFHFELLLNYLRSFLRTCFSALIILHGRSIPLFFFSIFDQF